LGFGSVLYGRSLIVQKRAIEPREVLPSTAEEREATREAYVAGKHDVGRRALLVAAGLSSAGIFGAMVVSLMRSLATPPDPTIFDTVWKQGQLLVTSDARPISADFLNAGDTVVVFPEGKIGSEHAQTVLIRVDERSLQLPPERANWAPKGYIAYSRVCTHAGCPVGMFERTTNLLLCPCHQSTFDVLRGAKPTAGPAARPLPQLPLYIDDAGVLRAGGGFSEPPGPGFWGLA
jgi:ubiquinol-cytochrome c reductase iron-sulfur subunit